MNILLTKSFALPAGQGNSLRHRRQERGFATLVVFILMVLMLGLVVQSGLVLRGLHQELRLLEKRQLKKFQLPPTGTQAVPTNTTNVLKLSDYGQNPPH